MNRSLAIRDFDQLLLAYRRLCEAMPLLIEQSSLKHRQIYQHPNLRSASIKMGKDTFYRRLNTNQWTPEELIAILPMIVENIKKSNKDFYREFKLTLDEGLDSLKLTGNGNGHGEVHS